MAIQKLGTSSFLLIFLLIATTESYFTSWRLCKSPECRLPLAQFAAAPSNNAEVVEMTKPKWRIVANNEDGDDSKPAKTEAPSQRVYTPRSGGAKHSWSPKSERSPSSGGSGGSGGGGGGSAIQVLNDPQFLIKFRVPKEKSDFKIQLETLQDMYRGEDSSSSRGYESSIFDSFSSDSSAGFKKGSKNKKEYERRNEDGMEKTRNMQERRSKVRIDDDDDDDDDSEDAGDYYGDEENLGLSSVPGSYLRNMEREGLAPDEMQIAIYSEYGIKASIQAIKRRILDDKSFKKTKKRSGKTRKDRTKARKARLAGDTDTGVMLPDQPTIQVQELGALMEVSSGEIVKHLMMNMGIMATMNQNIDIAVAKEIVIAFGQTLAGADEDDDDEDADEEEEEEAAVDADEGFTAGIDGGQVERVARPPVVTIMGHVDHGKTTLLDSIRKTQVALGEAGGITQGISAFRVRTQQDNDITFIDTPGHAAFSEMRTRGANVTDIVILVVAADDGIMEQTKECIVAAKAANCPVVVAVNKIDKEGANPQGVLTDLMSYDILAEEFGGDVQTAEVSAKKGVGIQELLDKILIQSELMNLKAAKDMRAEGTVIEARVDKRVGVTATALVREGTLKVGDYVLAGASWGRVRKLLSDQGSVLDSAGPTVPVQITGLTRVPNAGDTFIVTETEAEAREVAEARERLTRQSTGSQSSEAIFKQAAGLADGTWDSRELIKIPVLIKADVAGSIEALRSSLDALQISDDEATCMADIVYAGVGDVTSSDVAFASVSKAKILAFNVAAGLNAMDDARSGNVEIGYYSIVYDLLDEIKQTIQTTLAPPPPGKFVGSAEIQKVFRIGKVGKVAGCQVIDGTIKTDSQVRVMRGKRNPVFTGKISSLRVVKDIVTEVPSGSECGVSFEDFQDFMEGDVVECFARKGSDDDGED